MKKRKVQKIYFVFILLLFGLLITGCGGGNDITGYGLSPDTTAPTVTFTDPVTVIAPGVNTSGVAINKKITVTFSETMNLSTITTTTFTVTGPGATEITGTVTYTGVTAVFTPTNILGNNTTYTATITTGAEDLAGNALAGNYVWSFTTAAVADNTALPVTLTIPINGITDVSTNTKISATFSEAMDPTTITTESFTVTGPGSTAVPGTVIYSGVTAVFTPATDFTASTTYTVTITTDAEDLAGNALASDKVWSFTTGAAIDDTALPVTFTIPINKTTNVSTNTKISATFSEAMDPTTITTASFTVTGPGATVVPGTVIYSGVTAVFTPTNILDSSTTYTATITTDAEDLAFNALASDKVWNFTTAAALDTTAPTVTLIIPANGDTGVSTNTKISATFSEAMDPSTITATSFTVTGPGAAAVNGTVIYSGVTAVFTPTNILDNSTTYTAAITTGAEDLAGNALKSDYVWNFDTSAALDTASPTVSLTNPVDTASNVILSKKIQATFNEAMDPTTINTATFTLTDGVTPVSGTVTYVGLVATFTPATDLTADTTYTATITTGAEDLAGNLLVVPAVGLPPNPWTFTTIAAPPLGPAAVDLGTSENFVLLSKTGITNTGATAITGDIGVSPIDSTAITGFGLAMDVTNQFSTSVGGPGNVIGKVYAADYAVPTPANLTTAISDMETAFVDAAGRPIPDFTELGAGNISGMTLVPGLYKWGTGVLIDGTGVTISGGPDDVWIFQIAGNLTVNPGAIVTLAGGAQAKNIFWQVDGGTGVEFDTGTAFQGIILASKAIIFKTGATLTGRALAQTAVTLDGNTITAP